MARSSNAKTGHRIVDTALGARIKNGFVRNLHSNLPMDEVTLEMFQQFTYEDMLKFRDCGVRTVNKFCTVCAAYGISIDGFVEAIDIPSEIKVTDIKVEASKFRCTTIVDGRVQVHCLSKTGDVSVNQFILRSIAEALGTQ